MPAENPIMNIIAPAENPILAGDTVSVTLAPHTPLLDPVVPLPVLVEKCRGGMTRDTWHRGALQLPRLAPPGLATAGPRPVRDFCTSWNLTRGSSGRWAAGCAAASHDLNESTCEW